MKQSIFRKQQTEKRKNRINKNIRKGGALLPYRILSVIMVLILVMTTSSFGEMEINTKAAGTYDEESWNISVTINGVNIESVEKISPGDILKVDVKGILKDDGVYTAPYKKIVDLNTLEGVVIPEVNNAPLQVNGVVVGHADVTGGKIIITLEDVDSFLTGKKGREVNATISGYIDGSKDDHESGDTVDITIQSHKYSFVWDNKDEELTLGVQKQLGDFVLNADGSGKQYYTIRVNGNWVGDNENAKATLTSITDVSGSSLSSPAGFEITENTTTGNGASLAAGNTISDLSQLNNTVYKRNEYITVSYYMTVAKEAVDSYLETGSGNAALENKAQIAYLTNKKGTGSASSTVNTIRASRLNVTKTLNGGATDDLQTWTITVDVGAAYQSSKPNLSDYLDAISEIPGAGMVAAGGSTLGLSDFTPDGSGKFTAQYQTSLTEEYKNAESTTVKNEVKVTPKGKSPYSVYADYVTTGNGTGASVEKAFTSFDSAQRILTWTVTVKDLSTSATNVTVTDQIPYYVNGKEGTHNFLQNVTVNGTAAVIDGSITPEGSSIVSSIAVMDSHQMQLKLKDSYIAAHSGDITITFQTKIDPSMTSLKNFTFFNGAELVYDSEGTTKKKYPPEYAKYEDNSETGDALSKKGVLNAADGYQIDYTLTLDSAQMTYVTDADETKIIIKDKLPEGLTYVPDSAKALDYAKYTGYTASTPGLGYYKDNGDGTYSYNRYYAAEGYLTVPTTAMTTSYDEATREITFTLQAGKDFIIRAGAAKADGNADVHTKITYAAKIADEDAYTKAGETKAFQNEANGTYGSTNLNHSPAISYVSVPPEQLVTKDGGLNSFHIGEAVFKCIHYTVEINPGRRDLSSGKLKGTDKLGPALSYYLDSIKVYEVKPDSTLTELSRGDGESEYSFTYDDAANSLEFVLPDEKSLKIEYDAMINVYAGENSSDGGSLNAANAYNTFALEGYTAGNSKDGDYQNLINTRSEFDVRYENGAITIKKYWTDGGEIKAVTGTKFEVYKMQQNGSSFEKADAAPVDTVEITAADGVVRVTDLNYNTVYGLYEILPGETGTEQALALRPEPYLFVIPGSASYTAPAGVRQFAAGNYLYFENEPSDAAVMYISKEDGHGGKVSGAQLTLYKADGVTEIASWVTGETAKSIRILPSGECSVTGEQITIVKGTYVLKETAVPDGYVKAGDITFTADINSTDAVVASSSADCVITGSKLAMTDKKITDFKISKTAAGLGSELSGASFTLYDASGIIDINNIPADAAVIESWISGSEAHAVDGLKLKVGGEYILAESGAPLGYSKLYTNVKIKITEEGKAELVGTYTTGVIDFNAAENKLVITDSPLPTIEISKKAVSGVDELPGARLQLFDYHGDFTDPANSSYYSTAILQWVSGSAAKKIMADTSRVETLTGDNPILAPGKYVLNEKIAPDGYTVAEQVYFEITADGKIKSLNKEGNAITVAAGENGEVSIDQKMITMRDAKLVDLYIKKGAQGFSVNLEGAQLAIVSQKDLNAHGLTTRSAIIAALNADTITAIDKWTSTTTPYLCHNKLQAGEEYVLLEITAPTGFEALDTLFKFSVAADGTVSWKTAPPAEEAEIESYAPGSNNQITLKDKFIETSIEISKWTFDDIALGYTTEKIANAKFKLKHVGGSWEANWTSGTDAKVIKVGSEEVQTGDNISILPDTVYELEETDAPDTDHIILANKVQFKVGFEGIIILNSSYSEKAVKLSADKKELQIYNEHTPGEKRIAISKQSTQGTTAVAGAKFKLSHGEFIGGNYQIKEDGLFKDWTSSTTAAAFAVKSTENLPEGTLIRDTIYALQETDAPAHYAKNDEPVYFKIVQDGTGIKIEILQGDANAYGLDGLVLSLKNEPYLPLEISKAAAGSGEELAGANLALYKAEDLASAGISSADEINGSVTAIESWTSDGTIHKITDGLVANTEYALVETGAPAGYAQITTLIKFKLGSDGKVTLITGDVHVTSKSGSSGVENLIVLKNDYSLKTISISKKSVNGTDELPGAALSLQQGGIELAKWQSKADAAKTITIGLTEVITTDAEGMAESIQIKPGTYRLVESRAPEGYAIAEDIEFTIDAHGKITLVSANGEVSEGGKMLTMRDDALQNIYVSKAGFGGTELAGAIMKIYRKSDIPGGITSAEAIPESVIAVDSWTSGLIPHKVEGLEPGMEYAMIEKTAPDGYEGLTSIFYFRVDNTGNITLSDSYALLETGSYTTGRTDKITLTNKIKKKTITISKKAISGTEELAGAKLFLYAGSDTTGSPLANWTSSSSAREVNIASSQQITNIAGESISITITPGIYTLKESLAPKGYQIASSITFHVSEYGKITLLRGGGNVAGNQTEITMIDEPIRVKIAKKDKDTHEFLPMARLELYEYAGGSIGNKLLEWVSAGSEMTVDYNLLAVGKSYAIKEAAAPTGYESLSNVVIFTIQSNGSVSLDASASLTASAAGNVITVYNTKIPQKGSLKITKTIQGALTKEEAAGKIKFKVENITTGASNIYTIQNNFSYDSTSNRYVLTLTDIETGAYKVTEIYETPEGYEVTVTYSVNNTAEKGGSTAEAGVSAENVTTIDYKNDYKSLASPSPSASVSPSVSASPSASVSPGISTSPGASVSPSVSATPSGKPGKKPGIPKKELPSPTPGTTPSSTPSPNTGRSTIFISKKVIGGSEELSGATLAIYEGGDTAGEPLFSWISGTEPREIGIGSQTVVNGKSITLAPGRYTLKETGAPAGYSYAEEIPFRISNKGLLEKVNAEGEFSQDGTTLTMRDGIVDVSIRKVDLVNGQELPGAVIALYRKADINIAGSEPLEKWVSDGSDHRIETRLQAGAEYALVEETAPKGYQKLETMILFRVGTDGAVSFAEQSSQVKTETRIVEKGKQNVIVLMNDLLSSVNGKGHNTNIQTGGSQVKTGDTSHLLLWILMMAAGMGLIITAIIFGVRKKKPEDKSAE